MMLNNGAMVVAWVLFVAAFGSINGWGPMDVVGLQGVNSLAYGLAYGFCLGSVSMGTAIRSGAFDGFLLRPRRLLPLVWRSSFQESTVGDLLLGGILIGIAASATAMPFATFAIAGMLSLPAAMICVAMSTLLGSYTFWHPDDRITGDMLYRIFINPAMYPAGAYPDAVRVIFTLIVPSMLIGSVPWDTARSQLWLLVLAVWVAAFVWMGIAVLVFRAGLRRYESGGTG